MSCWVWMLTDQVVPVKRKVNWLFWVVVILLAGLVVYLVWDNYERIRKFFNSSEFAIVAIIACVAIAFFVFRKTRSTVIDHYLVCQKAIEYFEKHAGVNRPGVQQEVQRKPSIEFAESENIENKSVVFFRNISLCYVYDHPKGIFVSGYEQCTEEKHKSILADLRLDPKTREELRLRGLKDAE